jgi:putative transposase
MASVRSVHFRNEYIYHIYNRGVERRNIFLSTRDHERFIALLEYYRYTDIPRSFSHYRTLSLSERASYYESMQVLPQRIDILAYCLMPNHFHILVRQQREGGILEAISNLSNGYAKYFNTKHKRVGPLFQGPFKAVLIETDEQLVHVSRYIHLNPVVGGVIDEAELAKYPWSSLPVYLGEQRSPWVDTKPVLSHFHGNQEYNQFVNDQITYGKALEKIKHLVIEEV